ncbi:MAG: hypothetical protein PHF25_08105 [Candidatus Margulisbacteria bacterium]|nr:hypothetical protein [Candidatus Margulisiibacteriota bacterium]
MNNKTIAMKHYKLSFQKWMQAEIVSFFIRSKSNTITQPSISMIGKFSKEQALAVLQKTTSWYAYGVFLLLNEKLKDNKEVILAALKRTTEISHALSIISCIRTELRNSKALTREIANTLLVLYGTKNQILLEKVLQDKLFFTKEEVRIMIAEIKAKQNIS